MGFLEERDLSGVPTIPDFYKGKTIFITGGSGFMGKALVEKLLYSCTDLDRIYLLLRPKKGVKSEDRLEELYQTTCFERLREEMPGIYQSKVFVIAGDVSEPGLGLSEEDRALIVNRVNIIFHVAASIRFDDPLTFAAKLNLGGTLQLVELAKEVRQLEVLVHVSTSYSNTNRAIIEEVMYPPLADWRNTLEVCEKVDAHTIATLTQKYIGELPNTYVFTKQLAEHVVYEQRGKLPVVIIRPSIVISSISEPKPGWIENFNGPVGLMVASGKGIMRSLYSDPGLIADYIPVDASIKGIIAAAWIRGTKKLDKTDDIPIYNMCASNLNYMTMGEILEYGLSIAKEYPLNNALWTPGGDITKSKAKHYINVVLFHLLPAIFIDALLWILGKKTLLVKIQRRIYIANIALHYYVTKQWTFDNKNFISLRSRIKEQDKQKFFYDIENLDKYEFFKNACLAGRKYLLKEKEEELPKARRHYARMMLLKRVVHVLFYGFLLWYIVNTTYVKNFYYSILDIV